MAPTYRLTESEKAHLRKEVDERTAGGIAPSEIDAYVAAARWYLREISPGAIAKKASRPRRGRPRMSAEKRKEVEAYIVKRYKANRAIRDIMKDLLRNLEVELSYGTVNSILKANKVEMRGQGVTKREKKKQ